MLVRYDPLKSILGFDEPLFDWNDYCINTTGTWTDPFLKEATFDFKTKETDQDFLIRIQAAGFDKDEIAVEITDHVMSIRGEKKEKTDSWDLSGTFSRTFTLPNNVSEDRIKGELKNGILLITIPKKEKSVMKIEIQ